MSHYYNAKEVFHMIDPEVSMAIKALKRNCSQRRIAFELCISRNTVAKYVKSGGLPEYNRTAPYPSILDPYKVYIQERLDLYEKITAEKLHRKIKSQGFPGSYRIVAEYIRKVRPQPDPDAFLRYETKRGEYAQVDWGEFGTINHYGKKMKLYCFSMVLGWSRAQYIEFTVSCDLQALQRCHLHAFQYFGGVPEKILYDNMKTVALFHIGDVVKFNGGFLDFANHFGYIPKVCDVNAPNQKGKVERSIGFVRTSFFTGEEFRDLLDTNTQSRVWLDTVCNTRVHKTTGEVPFERLKKEREHLMPLPDTEYRICKVEYRKVHKDCYFSYKANYYSVPHKYVKRQVTVEVYATEIKVYYDNDHIATHAICPYKGKYIKDDAHFQGLLRRPRNRINKYEDIFSGFGDSGKMFLRNLIKSGTGNPFHHLSGVSRLMDNTPPEVMKFALDRAIKYKAYDYRTIKNIIEQFPKEAPKELNVKVNLVLCSQCQYEEVEERPLQYYEELLTFSSN